MDPYFKKFTKLFTKKIGRKIINRQYFHRETVFHMKTLSISNFTTGTPLLRRFLLGRISN